MTEWLAENPELLDTALEIVDAWDVFSGFQSTCEMWASPTSEVSINGSDQDQSDTVSTSSSSDRSDPLDSPDQAAQPRLPALAVKSMKIEKSEAVRPSTRRSTHYRRRAEIDDLRAKTAELERQLEQITASKQNRRSIPASGNVSRQARAIGWRDIARQQQKLRNVSELTHAKLRRRVEAQARMARGMAKLVEKAQKATTHSLTIHPVERPTGPPQIHSDASAFDVSEADQLRRIIAIHGSLDALFSCSESHTRNKNELDIRLVHDRPDQYVIEVSEMWIVPFDQRRTMDALWHFCLLKQQNKWCEPAFVQNSNLHVNMEHSEIISEIHAEACLGSARGRFDGRIITKRFDGSSPAIVGVSNFHSASSKLDPDCFAGLRNEEQACLRVLPVALSFPVSCSNNSGPRVMSRVQFHQRLTIAVTGDQDYAGTFVDVMLGKLKECVERMRETVETTLLLRPPSSGT